MSIYITGDIHGETIQDRINFELHKDDYLIVTGDVAFNWITDSEKVKREILEWYSSLPCTVLFVDGNHENFTYLNQLPVIDFLHGKASQVAPNIFHLKRGEIYFINSTKFFVMGGATSVDKDCRVQGVTWFPEEVPNYREMSHAIDNLEFFKNEVDFVVTHTAPTSKKCKFLNVHMENDPTSNFLEYVLEHVKFKAWYCGHFHTDLVLDGNFFLMYRDVLQVLTKNLAKSGRNRLTINGKYERV